MDEQLSQEGVVGNYLVLPKSYFNWFQEAIVRKKGQGGHALEGNQARKFLKKVDRLEQAVMQENSMTIITGMPFIAALRAFDGVVKSCFGMELAVDYKEKIDQFSKLYRELDISVTPKVLFLRIFYSNFSIFEHYQVHMVERHIVDFLELKGEVAGLGFWMEQAMESVHHDFRIFWERYKVDINHPEFGLRLRAAVSAYNRRHL